MLKSQSSMALPNRALRGTINLCQWNILNTLGLNDCCAYSQCYINIAHVKIQHLDIYWMRCTEKWDKLTQRQVLAVSTGEDSLLSMCQPQIVEQKCRNRNLQWGWDGGADSENSTPASIAQESEHMGGRRSWYILNVNKPQFSTQIPFQANDLLTIFTQGSSIWVNVLQWGL